METMSGYVLVPIEQFLGFVPPTGSARRPEVDPKPDFQRAEPVAAPPPVPAPRPLVPPPFLIHQPKRGYTVEQLSPDDSSVLSTKFFLTQTDVAAFYGISRPAVSRIVRGKRIPNICSAPMEAWKHRRITGHAPVREKRATWGCTWVLTDGAVSYRGTVLQLCRQLQVSDSTIYKLVNGTLDSSNRMRQSKEISNLGRFRVSRA